MNHYWKERNETTRLMTNQFIENTPLGRDYVEQVNEIYKESENLFAKKKAVEKENRSYQDLVEQYERQYNSAKTMLALAKTNYNLCNSNCSHIQQNIRNINNNMNNLIDKINRNIDGMNRTYSQGEDISRRLYALDRKLRELLPEVRAYFRKNMNNGTIGN